MKLLASSVFMVSLMVHPGYSQSLEEADSCPGIVSNDPAHMYDFKLGEWNVTWRNKSSAGVFEFSSVSTVYSTLEGDVQLDEQRSRYFKGLTFRTFDDVSGTWVVRWLPADSPGFDHPITGTLEDCVPVERHHQLANAQFPGDNRRVEVVTRFTDITENGFKFRQDWSFDSGTTWEKDVLYYEAKRIVSK